MLNTLIGPSSYAFLRAYHELGQRDPDFAADLRPVLSCNFAESEAAALGEVIAGHYVIAPYFQSLDSEDNRRFLSTARRLSTAQPDLSAFFRPSLHCRAYAGRRYRAGRYRYAR